MLTGCSDLILCGSKLLNHPLTAAAGGPESEATRAGQGSCPMVVGDTGTGQARSIPELSGAPGAWISKYLRVFGLPQTSYQTPWLLGRTAAT